MFIFFVQNVCPYFFNLIFPFKLIVDISVHIDCWYFCPNWLLLFVFFKLVVNKFAQIDCWHFFSKLIVVISLQIVLIFLFKLDCWYFRSNWLLISFGSNRVMIILFKLIVTFCFFKLIVDNFVQIDCRCFCANWHFWSNWLFKFLFKMIVHLLVQFEYSSF